MPSSSCRPTCGVSRNGAHDTRQSARGGGGRDSGVRSGFRARLVDWHDWRSCQARRRSDQQFDQRRRGRCRASQRLEHQRPGRQQPAGAPVTPRDRWQGRAGAVSRSIVVCGAATAATGALCSSAAPAPAHSTAVALYCDGQLRPSRRCRRILPDAWRSGVRCARRRHDRSHLQRGQRGQWPAAAHLFTVEDSAIRCPWEARSEPHIWQAVYRFDQRPAVRRLCQYGAASIRGSMPSSRVVTKSPWTCSTRRRRVTHANLTYQVDLKRHQEQAKLKLIAAGDRFRAAGDLDSAESAYRRVLAIESTSVRARHGWKASRVTGAMRSSWSRRSRISRTATWTRPTGDCAVCWPRTRAMRRRSLCARRSMPPAAWSR